jgi:hypothetical protein
MASFRPPRLWKCTSKAQTRSFCYLSPDARKKDTHALHHPSLARSLSLSLSLSQHICITLVIASHLQRIWAWVHKHPWLHVNACGVSKSFEQFRCTNEEENRSRRRTRRSYIYVYVYVCAFLEIAHLITVPPYRYQHWNNLLSIFIFGMMRKDYSVPSWMESCTVGVVTSVVRIFLCSD